MTDHQHCQAITTIGSRAAAEALSRSAVQARLAACGQVTGPITSTYWWDGQLETAEEWYVIFKTTTERYPALAEHIRAHHDYDVPEIVLVPIVAGDPTYLAWVTEQTSVEG